MNNTARRQRQEPITEPDYKFFCLMVESETDHAVIGIFL
jgi:hypothetical protein